MGKKQEQEHNMVEKQTLIGAIVISLVIGFLGGAYYSSAKLGTGTAAPTAPAGMANQASGQEDVSAQIGAKILQLEQYLNENPKDEKAWAQLGNMFFDSDQFVNAIDAYKKSLEINPKQIGVVTDMGVMYRRNKQPQKAIEAFDKAIAIDPTFETPQFNKGIVLLHDLNDMAGGLKAWEELVEANPLAMAPNGESVDAIIQRMKNQKTK